MIYTICDFIFLWKSTQKTRICNDNYLLLAAQSRVVW